LNVSATTCDNYKKKKKKKKKKKTGGSWWYFTVEIEYYGYCEELIRALE